MKITNEIKNLISRGALFVVNHSGGKDSQAMFIELKKAIPKNQLLVIHASLAGVEWEGTAAHAQKYLDGIDYRECEAVTSLLDRVKLRGKFPSPQQRWCTSDLKRGPIDKQIRHYIIEKNLSGLVVSCQGMRAEESTNRAKMETFQYYKRNSKAGRECYTWMPIHDYKIGQVFDTIAAANEKPHWAYGVGMSRLSCCFCIMASPKDLTIAAKHNPEMYSTYVAMEKATGQTLMMPRKGVKRTLEEITGIKAR